MLISLIIPVYNRPQETEELLESLALQTRSDFETVIVEDGSSPDSTSEAVAERYRNRLDITYVTRPNGGPAAARNTGVAAARGDFFIITDSDCVLPPGYMAAVYEAVERGDVEFFGGPDMAAPDFSPLQKAVSYSMTSPFTTGGIRGRKRAAGGFSPRSFNLGVSRRVFWLVGGFSDMRIGEDIDFSLRIMEQGIEARFLPEAAVCHKRRTSFRQFFKQVFIFGTARVNLGFRHRRARKVVYLLPALFTVGSAAMYVAAACSSPWFLFSSAAAAALWSLSGTGTVCGLLLVSFMSLYAPWWFSVPFGALMLLWLVDSARANQSLQIGWLSVWTSFIQLYGYGFGFLYGLWMRVVLRRDEPYTYRVTGMFARRK